MIAAGFVAHELIGEVKWLDAYFHIVPSLLHAAVPAAAFGWWEAVWFLILVPAVVWSMTAAVAYLLGHRTGAKALLLAVATGAARWWRWRTWPKPSPRSRAGLATFRERPPTGWASRPFSSSRRASSTARQRS